MDRYPNLNFLKQPMSWMFSDLNALTRSLDLTCKVLSPTVAGFIMTYASLFISAVFIAIWNIVSVFIEYGLLLHVYRLVPRLAVKQSGMVIHINWFHVLPLNNQVQSVIIKIILIMLVQFIRQCSVYCYTSRLLSQWTDRGIDDGWGSWKLLESMHTKVWNTCSD